MLRNLFRQLMTDNTRHAEIAQLLFNHAMAVIEANDKRYNNLFSLYDRAGEVANHNLLKETDALKEIYFKGHTDVVNKIDALQSINDNSKGTSYGMRRLTGWLFAVLTIFASTAVHFFDKLEPKDSKQSLVNGQLLEEIKHQAENNYREDMDIRAEIAKHDQNTKLECK